MAHKLGFCHSAGDLDRAPGSELLSYPSPVCSGHWRLAKFRRKNFPMSASLFFGTDVNFSKPHHLRGHLHWEAGHTVVESGNAALADPEMLVCHSG